jgi:hypothetical protein
MNGVDLSIFATNHDYSWSVFFLNADMTVYGRYGTRGDKGMEAYVSIQSLKNAMTRVLELHSEYPQNKKEFVGKKPDAGKVRWKVAEDIPALKKKRGNQNNKKFPGGCIHCHSVTEAVASTAAQNGQPVPDTSIWPFPLPDAVGVSIDVNHGTKVEKVIPKSFAARAKVKPGDIILSMDGQTILSIADIQWVLHHANDRTKLKIVVMRGGKEKKLTLKLNGDWRKSSHAWGGVGRNRLLPWSNIQPVPDNEKKKLGISLRKMALRMVKVWGKTKNQGFQDGDIIVKVDRRQDNMSRLDLTAYLSQNCVKMKFVPVIILRKNGSGKYVPKKMDLPLDPNYVGR